MNGRPRGSPDRYGHAQRVDVEVKKRPQWRALARLIGHGIKTARERRDVAASELAAAIGSSVTVIYRWEKGVNPPHLSSLLAISLALDCPLSALIPTDVRKAYA